MWCDVSLAWQLRFVFFFIIFNHNPCVVYLTSPTCPRHHRVSSRAWHQSVVYQCQRYRRHPSQIEPVLNHARPIRHFRISTWRYYHRLLGFCSSRVDLQGSAILRRMYTSHRKLKMKNEIVVHGTGPIATMLRSVIMSFSDISVEMERLFNSTKCQPDVVKHDHHSKHEIRQLFVAVACFIIVEVYIERMKPIICSIIYPDIAKRRLI